MTRYLIVWIGATCALLLGVAAINSVVDPYGMVRLVDQPGFNHIKPAAGAHGAVSKAYQVLRVQPRTLILGNSRAEVGLDPAHPAWQARPVYNAALPGTGTHTSLRYLQHLLASSSGDPAIRPQVVLWGIDFMDFLTDPDAPRPAQLTVSEDLRLRLPADADSVQWRQRTRDYLASALTLTALLDSAHTVARQDDVYAAHLSPLGFNPMRDYLQISATEGYWNVFRQRDHENVKAYLQRPRSIFDSSGASSPALDDLRELVRLCRAHGIALQLFTYPYHAHLLEIIRLTGHGPALEIWKRTVAQLLHDEAQASASPAFALWDFSTYNTFSTERVPAQGDRASGMQWYWEAGHFKSALGGLMLDRMQGQSRAPAELGVLMTVANAPSHMELYRELGEQYRAANSAEVQVLADLVAQVRRQRAKEPGGVHPVPVVQVTTGVKGAGHAQIQLKVSQTNAPPGLGLAPSLER